MIKLEQFKITNKKWLVQLELAFTSWKARHAVGVYGVQPLSLKISRQFQMINQKGWQFFILIYFEIYLI